ncbi:MAG: DNA repair protein RecN [Coriobacteriia bacterium]|nr:DNA repair protein RecN [Coriobacteriia bacterium]
MLDELEVNNYALIERASIEFSPGFTVLTGETGAGKTALIGAIKLLIGERADVSAITDGADELRVAARLIDEDNREVIVSRRLNRSGRSRAAIDSQMTTVTALAEQVGTRFDLLGQHEHQNLLSGSAQQAYLDQFGAISESEVFAAYQQAWHDREQTGIELAMLQEQARQSAQSLEQSRFTLEQIEAVNPQVDEYEQLEADIPILRRGEDLAVGSNAAWQLLGADDQVSDLLAQAARQLSSVRGIDARLDALADRLQSAQIDLEDISAELITYRDSVSFDAQVLEDTQSRLGQLEGLVRRFNAPIREILVLRDQARLQLEMADNLPDRIEAVAQRLESEEKILLTVAAELAAKRNADAIALAERLTARLKDLAFGSAAIEIVCEGLPRQSWSATGSQRCELLFRPQPRSVSRPLSRIASGGELSRVMLALKSELIASDGMTLVFDEVDAGIGGIAATAVAEYLKRLASNNQVIVVTHLAQIAAVADRHYVVQRDTGGGEPGTSAQPDPAGATSAQPDPAGATSAQPVLSPSTSEQQDPTQPVLSPSTSVFEVVGDQRVLEVARMLSGSSDDVAIAHARELLQGDRVE